MLTVAEAATKAHTSTYTINKKNARKERTIEREINNNIIVAIM